LTPIGRSGGADAVGGDEGFGVGEVGRDAGGGDALRCVDARGHFEVEVEELLEEVAFGGKAVGGEDGGIEGGVYGKGAIPEFRPPPSKAPYFRLKNFFKFASPFTAMSSRFGSILRQMAAARAMTFTSVVKLSMTTSPL